MTRSTWLLGVMKSRQRLTGAMTSVPGGSLSLGTRTVGAVGICIGCHSIHGCLYLAQRKDRI